MWWLVLCVMVDQPACVERLWPQPFPVPEWCAESSRQVIEQPQVDHARCVEGDRPRVPLLAFAAPGVRA